MKPTEHPESGGIPPVAAEAPITGETLPDFSFDISLQKTDVSTKQVSEAVAVPITEVSSTTEDTPITIESLKAADASSGEEFSKDDDILIIEDSPKTDRTASKTKDSSMNVPDGGTPCEEVSVPIAEESLKAESVEIVGEIAEPVDVSIAKKQCETEDVIIIEDAPEMETASNTENSSKDMLNAEKTPEEVAIPVQKLSSNTEDARSTGEVTEQADASNPKKPLETGDVPITENPFKTAAATDTQESSRTAHTPVKKDDSNAKEDQNTPRLPRRETVWSRDVNAENVTSEGETSGTGSLPDVKSSTRVAKRTRKNAEDTSADEDAAGPSSSTANRARGRPRKRARLTMPKETPNKKKVEKAVTVVEDEVPDREAYEVEKIISTKLKGRQLFYYMKWKDYPEESNTLEPETRADCEHLMHEYILERIDPSDYVNCLQRILNDISDGGSMEFLVIVVPLSAIGLTTVQTGTAKAITHDTVDARLSYLKYLNRYNQQYTLYALKMPTSTQLRDFHKKYLQQLRFRFETFPEYPAVEIVMPRELTEVEGLYPPPPIYTLLFEPVSEEMAEEREKYPHMFPPKSEEQAYNKSQVFANDRGFKPKNDAEDPRVNVSLVNRMPRRDFERNPRFAVNFRLHQEAPRGWILSAGHDVKPYTPLLMMTGVIRPSEVAHECLEVYGEAVAFSSFIEIPNTGKCLDRREFYDFSKFIPHSCTPTCSVRLVDSGNEIPDLVVYNLVPLERFNNRNITLDYYKAFTADVKAFFRGLGDSEVDSCPLLEKSIDFMKCQCMSQFCRRVLYVDKSKKRAAKSVSKRQKLATLDPDFAFHGAHLADPNKIWTIQNYKFQN